MIGNLLNWRRNSGVTALRWSALQWSPFQRTHNSIFLLTYFTNLLTLRVTGRKAQWSLVGEVLFYLTSFNLLFTQKKRRRKILWFCFWSFIFPLLYLFFLSSFEVTSTTIKKNFSLLSLFLYILFSYTFTVTIWI